MQEVFVAKERCVDSDREERTPSHVLLAQTLLPLRVRERLPDTRVVARMHFVRDSPSLWRNKRKHCFPEVDDLVILSFCERKTNGHPFHERRDVCCFHRVKNGLVGFRNDSCQHQVGQHQKTLSIKPGHLKGMTQ